jgi:hypothetical protein
MAEGRMARRQDGDELIFLYGSDFILMMKPSWLTNFPKLSSLPALPKQQSNFNMNFGGKNIQT